MSHRYLPEPVKARVRADARYACGYCQSPQEVVYGALEIEHIIPQAKGGNDDEENLWLACRMCNQYKATQTRVQDPLTGRWARLYNPRTQRWSRHFRWSEDGTQVIGRTICGRATVLALNLNNPIAIRVRRKWTEAGWHPPA